MSPCMARSDGLLRVTNLVANRAQRHARLPRGPGADEPESTWSSLKSRSAAVFSVTELCYSSVRRTGSSEMSSPRCGRHSGNRIMRGTIASCAILVLLAGTADAEQCPPGALGVSRTLVVDPNEHPRVGSMQYPETLPLNDHEVVLTFDDGPLPRY